MKYNIHVTQAAERDMANAYDYIDLVRWTMPRKRCISCGFSTAKATGSPF